MFLFILGCASPTEDTGAQESRPGEITLFAGVMGRQISTCSVYEDGEVIGKCGEPLAFTEARHWLHLGDPLAGTSDDGYPLLPTPNDGLWIVDDIQATVRVNSDAAKTCEANQFAFGTWECTGDDLPEPARGTVMYLGGNQLSLPGLNAGLTVERRTLHALLGGTRIDGVFIESSTIALTLSNTQITTRTCVAVEE